MNDVSKFLSFRRSHVTCVTTIRSRITLDVDYSFWKNLPITLISMFVSPIEVHDVQPVLIEFHLARYSARSQPNINV